MHKPIHRSNPDARPHPNSTKPVLSRGKKLFFLSIMVVLPFVLAEMLARRVMPPDIAVGRDILLGREEAQLVRMQKTIAQPYLLYTSAPNYRDPEFGLQHNEDGYRGLATPMDRRPGVYRILCLGGSTTYGTGVGRWEDAYPAVLERLLREDLPDGYHDVEVINGGLTWGTSAEMLTHYHFKYHYYRPDLVIINEGLNDAEGYTLPYYHPDNSNWRQPMLNLRPLPPGWRWLALSRLASAAILNVFYQDQLRGGEFVIRDGAVPPAPWFKPGGQLARKRRKIPREQLSFLHNVETLIRSVLADGAQVLLVPSRANPKGYRGKEFELSQILRHERIFVDLARKYSLSLAPFPASIISPGNWTDHCHLNASGEREKARHVAEFVKPIFHAASPDRL